MKGRVLKREKEVDPPQRREREGGPGGVPLTARGPLRATLFLSMLLMADSGMVVLPSLSTGVTSTGSQVMGVYASVSLRSWRAVVLVT